MPINWVSAYNHLFHIIDLPGETYFGGPKFISVLKQVDVGVPSYQQLIELRNTQRKSTSRRDYYWDLLRELNEGKRLQVFEKFIDILAPLKPDEVAELKKIVFGSDTVPVPRPIVPPKTWNADKLNEFLRKIDDAISFQEYNRAVTLSYSCLEGLYKAFIRQRIPDQAVLSDLIPMSREIKNYISQQLSATGAYPEQMVNVIPTLTNAIAYSRNQFSESHFDNNANVWLAVFAEIAQILWVVCFYIFCKRINKRFKESFQ
jgi:hypothetical protein